MTSSQREVAMDFLVNVQSKMRRVFIPCIMLYAMSRMVPGERALQRYLTEAEKYDKTKPAANECVVTLRPMPPYVPVMALANVQYPRGLGDARMVGMLGVWVEY